MMTWDVVDLFFVDLGDSVRAQRRCRPADVSRFSFPPPLLLAGDDHNIPLVSPWIASIDVSPISEPLVVTSFDRSNGWWDTWMTVAYRQSFDDRQPSSSRTTWLMIWRDWVLISARKLGYHGRCCSLDRPCDGVMIDTLISLWSIPTPRTPWDLLYEKIVGTIVKSDVITCHQLRLIFVFGTTTDWR